MFLAQRVALRFQQFVPKDLDFGALALIPKQFAKQCQRVQRIRVFVAERPAAQIKCLLQVDLRLGQQPQFPVCFADGLANGSLAIRRIAGTPVTGILGRFQDRSNFAISLIQQTSSPGRFS
jgi:hypothetical protein